MILVVDQVCCSICWERRSGRQSTVSRIYFVQRRSFLRSLAGHLSCVCIVLRSLQRNDHAVVQQTTRCTAQRCQCSTRSVDHILSRSLAKVMAVAEPTVGIPLCCFLLADPVAGHSSSSCFSLMGLIHSDTQVSSITIPRSEVCYEHRQCCTQSIHTVTYSSQACPVYHVPSQAYQYATAASLGSQYYPFASLADQVHEHHVAFRAGAP